MARGATARQKRRAHRAGQRAARGLEQVAPGRTPQPEKLDAAMTVTGSTSLPLSDRDTPWDAGAAWRSMGGRAMLNRACFYRDPEGDPETKTAYKLIFAQNRPPLTAVWRGVTAVAGVLQGARGGVNIPDADKAGVRRKVEGYYAKARRVYKDPDIKVPWASGDTSAAELLAYAETRGGDGYQARLDHWTAEFQAEGECACGHMDAQHQGRRGACMAAGCDCQEFEPANGEELSEEQAALAKLEARVAADAASTVGREALAEAMGFDKPLSEEEVKAAKLEARLRGFPTGPDGAEPDPVIRLTLRFDTHDGPVTREVSSEDAHEVLQAVQDALAPALPVLPTRPEEQPVANAELHWTATLCPEGVATDDGRLFAPGSISWRELPLTLMAMTETQEGHDGAQVAGRIDRIWRAGNLIKGEGVFDDGEYGAEIARLVDERVLRGVSVDIAVRRYEYGSPDQFIDADGNWLEPEDRPERPSGEDEELPLFGDDRLMFVVTDGVIGCVTVVPFPAFEAGEISMVASGVPGVWTYRAQTDMVVVAQQRPEAVTAAAAVEVAPVSPPSGWFADPEFSEPTPLTVTDDGRVYGHAAMWGTCHIAFPDVCTTAPRSRTGYAYFHLGEVECDDGERVAIGKITVAKDEKTAAHAGPRLSRAAATEHYDNACTVAAFVRAGEDRHGIWVTGCLAPGVDEEQVALLRSLALSGDWRNVDGNLEMIAVLAVPVPGFPVPRALVASGDEGTEVLTLLSAGIVTEKTIERHEQELDALTRVAAGELAQLVEEAKA